MKGPSRPLRPVLRIFGGVIAVAALVSIVRMLWHTLPQLGSVQFRLFPTLLALGVGCGISLLHALLWRSTLHRLGATLPLPVAMRIWLISQLMRYAPGNVWYLVGRISLAQQQGTHPQPVGLSMVFELLQTMTAGMVVAVLFSLFWPHQLVLGGALVLLLPLLTAVLFPSVLQAPLSWALRRMGRQGMGRMLRRRDMLLLLPGYGLAWVAYGIGLYLLAWSLHPLPFAALPAIISIYAVSWIIGFLSFLTPSGLGVREGVLGYLLSSLIPLPAALLLALTARVWLTLAEIMTAMLVLVLWRGR